MPAKRFFHMSAAVAFVLCMVTARPSSAAWPPDPYANIPICTASGIQTIPRMVADGTGGAIITWLDNRAGTSNIYARRISADGFPLWSADGEAICTATGGQHVATLCSDEVGGAIIVWGDARSGTGDIYSQRVSANGTVLWTTDGVAVCAATGHQWEPAIVSDGTGGAIIAWEDRRSGTPHIYAQRVSAKGNALWAPNGIPMCIAAVGQVLPLATADGTNGAIVGWEDYRSGSGNADIYAQRVSADGTTMWPADGVIVRAAVIGEAHLPRAIPDGASGAFFTWQDNHLGDWDIYAQHVSGGGVPLWTSDGKPVCTAAGVQGHPAIAPDGASGAIITWIDGGRSPTFDIYAQRVSADGVPLWMADGMRICTASRDQLDPRIISDRIGGAIIAWLDSRDGHNHIYAQQVDAYGYRLWTDNGLAICAVDPGQGPPDIAPNGAGGAVIAWEDARNEASRNSDIYAQTFEPDLSTGTVASLVNSDAQPDRIQLTWHSGGHPGIVAKVYRRTADEDWTPLAAITADGDGYLRYEDRTVATGTRYGYRLGIMDAGSEVFAGEVWITAENLRFALDGVRPNPALGGQLTVSFVLPSAVSAKVELLDIAGRRVAEHEVGSLGPGRHAVDLTANTRLAPGVYFVRLRQGESLLATRVAVLN